MIINVYHTYNVVRDGLSAADLVRCGSLVSGSHWHTILSSVLILTHDTGYRIMINTWLLPAAPADLQHPPGPRSTLHWTGSELDC